MSDDVEQKMLDGLEKLAQRLDALEGHLRRAAEPAGPEYMTIAEAAQHFRISAQHLYRMRNVLVKIGRRVNVDVAKLREKLANTAEEWYG